LCGKKVSAITFIPKSVRSYLNGDYKLRQKIDDLSIPNLLITFSKLRSIHECCTGLKEGKEGTKLIKCANAFK
jgi:hypothetical protein